MIYSAEERCRIWLKSVDGIGPARFYRLIAEFGSAQSVWENLRDMPPELAKQLTPKVCQGLRNTRDDARLDSIIEKLDSLGIEAVTTESGRYPQPLLDIFDAPPVLFLRGSAPVNYDRRFAVVGSRRATYDGKRAAREISELLSQNGVSIVSGLASGIDSEAHRGALAGKTHTVAVLGCGPDVIYPSENRKLYEQILNEGGLIVSEHLPGTQPLRQYFPLRNRIISGMSQGVMLVEGTMNSGAMITVNYALEQGRDVLAVPGSIYAPLSAGPNRMIADGAEPVLNADSVLAHFGWGEQAQSALPVSEIQLEPDEKRVVAELMYEPLTFDELIMQTMLPASELNTLLTMLELRSIIHKLPGGQYKANT